MFCAVHGESEKDLDKCVALAIINFQDRSHVPTSVAIIRCTKYGYHLLFLFHDIKQFTEAELESSKLEERKGTVIYRERLSTIA